ncbi:MAG: hypothetical protein DMF69_05765 [Acidobacteria bacterium]|nr:MAG: hypothetical protein DMF69_05765 [Acidobacteriota bacterium]
MRQILATREPKEDFDWGNTWVAEMFMSHAEQKRRRIAMERKSGITPEIKRYTEMKAGVILTSTGIGVTIFLFFLMQGVIQANPGSGAILQYIFLAGLIPIFVGLALIFNGYFISKKLVEIANRQKEPNQLPANDPKQLSSPAPDTNEFKSTPFSVTEHSTRHLKTPDKK